MKLTVHFTCTVYIRELEKNYTGEISLWLKDCAPKRFFFLSLNPYGGRSAEFSLFLNKEQSIVFAEAVGNPEQGFNHHTGKPITYYEFSFPPEENTAKTGIVFIAQQIISEAIYRTEVEWQDRQVKQLGSTPPSSRFEAFWEKTFKEGAEKYGYGAIEALTAP